MESTGQAADVCTKMLCGMMFEVQAHVVESKRGKSGTTIDRDKRRCMKDGGGSKQRVNRRTVILSYFQPLRHVYRGHWLCKWAGFTI